MVGAHVLHILCVCVHACTLGMSLLWRLPNVGGQVSEAVSSSFLVVLVIKPGPGECGGHGRLSPALQDIEQ